MMKNWMKRWVLLGLAATATGHVAMAQEDDVIRVRKGPVSESTLVGPYNQPEWTTARRFPTTRVYLQQPPGGVGFEQWVRSKYYDGERGKHRVQEEIEIGLPNRFQLDLYINSEINEEGTWYYDNFATEGRYALADWGKIPMNPTLYAEYKIKDEGADVAEGKLLLGDELARDWHWGVNLSYEWDLGGEQAEEYGFAAALSRVVVDRKFSVGGELLIEHATVKNERSDPEKNVSIGPSVQWRPTRDTHLDLVLLAGTTDDAPDMTSYIVLGYDFGSESPEGPKAPVSTRSD